MWERVIAYPVYGYSLHESKLSGHLKLVFVLHLEPWTSKASTGERTSTVIIPGELSERSDSEIQGHEAPVEQPIASADKACCRPWDWDWPGQCGVVFEGKGGVHVSQVE